MYIGAHIVLFSQVLFGPSQHSRFRMWSWWFLSGESWDFHKEIRIVIKVKGRKWKSKIGWERKAFSSYPASASKPLCFASSLTFDDSLATSDVLSGELSSKPGWATNEIATLKLPFVLSVKWVAGLNDCLSQCSPDSPHSCMYCFLY